MREFVQAAGALHQPFARPQIQMIRVAENDLAADGAYLVLAERFYRSLRAHRHEYRRENFAVRRDEFTATCAGCAILRKNFERKCTDHFKYFAARQVLV